MDKVINFDEIAARYCLSGHFNIDASNSAVLKQIFAYTEGKEVPGIDPKKGICLSGPKGTGKSVIMKTLAVIQGYAIDNIVSLPGYYQQKGDVIFEQYSKRYRNKDGEQVLNFRMANDLGREEKTAQFMGVNYEDPGARYVFERYELFQNFKIKTNFTTNIESAQGFIDRYGELNYDRICEMCNFLILEGPSRR